MMMEDNIVTGCTPDWSLKSFVDCINGKIPLSMKDLKDNEVHSLCMTYKRVIESVKDIKLSDSGHTL